jgi:hypothetical protein
VQRSTQESHPPPDGSAASQTADSLVHHRLEHRGRDILSGGPFVQEWLDVALGEDPAPGGNRVDDPVAGGQVVQPGRVCAQQGRHLIDERPGSPSTGTIHPLFETTAEEGELGVLAAQFDHHIGPGQ